MLQELLNAITLGSIYLLFALGMSLAWGTIGILNFAHGSVFMFSAFVAYLFVRSYTLPMPVMVVIGMGVGALLSVLMQVVAFETIQRRSTDAKRAELQILVGGIGMASALLAVAQHVTKSVPFGFSAGSFATKTYELGPIRLNNVAIVIIIAALGLSAVIAWWLRSSRSGLALRAIGVDPEVARMMGVDRRKLALVTMAIAGALAGLAGVLLTYYLGSIAPESGEAFLLKGFAAIILGGVGSVAGAATGAMVLAVAETLVLTYTSGTWVDAVSFGLIFAMLLVRPRGLFGRQEVRRT